MFTSVDNRGKKRHLREKVCPTCDGSGAISSNIHWLGFYRAGHNNECEQCVGTGLVFEEVIKK